MRRPPLASHIHTRALKQFWLLETATAAARSEFEFLLGSEFADNNFENVVTPPTLRPPVVHRGGVVDRKLAAQMTSLMQAEQAEVLNLYALDVSPNRATEAEYERGRHPRSPRRTNSGAHWAISRPGYGGAEAAFLVEPPSGSPMAVGGAERQQRM